MLCLMDGICVLRAILICRSPHPDSSTARSNQESAQDFPARKIGLLARPFGLGWRDRNKVGVHLYSPLFLIEGRLSIKHKYFKISLSICIIMLGAHGFVQ
jgi:hypothetical protein